MPVTACTSFAMEWIHLFQPSDFNQWEKGRLPQGASGR
jgi:hypothetical protein